MTHFYLKPRKDLIRKRVHLKFKERFNIHQKASQSMTNRVMSNYCHILVIFHQYSATMSQQDNYYDQEIITHFNFPNRIFRLNSHEIETTQWAKKWKRIITDYATSPNAQTIDAKYHNPLIINNIIMSGPQMLKLLMQSIIIDNFVSGDGENQASVKMQSIITDYHILLQLISVILQTA